LACWTDSVRAAMRSRALPGCSGSAVMAEVVYRAGC
jgi:hypothetical protein